MDEAGPEAGQPDAPRLSPGEIASRDFARVPDGLDEQQVRAFLNEIADLVTTLSQQEQQLHERVRELEERVSGAPPDDAQTEVASTRGPNARVAEVFARLRATDNEPPPEPPPPPAPPAARSAEEPMAGPVATPLEPEPTEPESTEPEPTPDDELRARRDALLDPLAAELLRAAKRLLQDEQNVLLDAARRARARVDPVGMLPEPVHHRDAWAALLAPALGTAYSGGRTAVARSRRPSSAPERVVNELAAGLVAPLRERLTATTAAVLAEGPYESPAELHRELASAIGARYREWRGGELEMRLGDALAAAYARGTYDGAPSGSKLRWVKDAGQRCPDCEDNSLEPTRKGQGFPTGQSYPPAHAGCRCLVVPVEERGE